MTTPTCRGRGQGRAPFSGPAMRACCGRMQGRLLERGLVSLPSMRRQSQSAHRQDAHILGQAGHHGGRAGAGAAAHAGGDEDLEGGQPGVEGSRRGWAEWGGEGWACRACARAGGHAGPSPGAGWSAVHRVRRLERAARGARGAPTGGCCRSSRQLAQRSPSLDPHPKPATSAAVGVADSCHRARCPGQPARRTMSAPCTAVPISWWLSCAASSPSSGLPPVPAGTGEWGVSRGGEQGWAGRAWRAGTACRGADGVGARAGAGGRPGGGRWSAPGRARAGRGAFATQGGRAQTPWDRQPAGAVPGGVRYAAALVGAGGARTHRGRASAASRSAAC